MRLRNALRLLAAAALVGGMITAGAPAQSQVPGTSVGFRFAGTAAVSPGIFFPGFNSTGPWTWTFTSSGCDAAGRSKGTPVAGTGNCAVHGEGDLLADLVPDPACGNSKGTTRDLVADGIPAAYVDDGARRWTGEVHWDGVLVGDPSYSAGSQLVLFGTGTNGTGAGNTVSIILVLNASGGQNCAPAVSPGGATSFTVNGVGSVRG